jgi:hypothetical protein
MSTSTSMPRLSHIMPSGTRHGCKADAVLLRGPDGLGGFIHTLTAKTAKTTKREDCELHAANYFRSSLPCAGAHPWRMKMVEILRGL